MASFLVWLHGSHSGQTHALAEHPLEIGRSDACTLVVHSERASRRHAVIVPVQGGYELRDQGSSNGTLLNGRRVQQPARLRHGDLIDIGDERFRFEERRHSFAHVRLVALGVLVLAGLGFALAGVAAQGRSVLPAVPAPAAPNAGLAVQSAAMLPRAAASTTGSWTLLVYLDGDNDLEHDAVADFNEMELVGSSEQVQVLVQFDRMRGGRSSLFDDDWTTTRRYKVTHDTDPNRIASPLLADLGELNMGDPRTLADFITWGIHTAPADHYALVIWDHGSAWAGIAFDDSSGKDGLTLQELDTALRTAQAETGLDRLDMIGFDACVMGQIDVLAAVAPYARTMVASADLEPNAGWPWDRLLQRMNADPAMDGYGLARASVEVYGEAYAADTSPSLGLAAFDLADATQLRDRAGAFSDAVLADMAGSYQAVAEARSYVTLYSQPRPEEFNAVDLGQLARLTVERGAPAPVAEAARALADTIDQARIAGWSSQVVNGIGGLSAFFPQVAERYPTYYSQVSPIAQQTSWARFLQAFHQAGLAEVAAPTIADLVVTAGPQGGAQLSGTVSGDQIANVFFFVGIPDADRAGVQLVTLDYAYPNGSAASAVPAWNSALNSVQARWDGMQWALAGDGAPVPVLLGPVRPGGDQYGVEGRFMAQGSGEAIDAALLFQRQGDQMVLQSVYGFPRGLYQEAQPFQIHPAPGDTFTVHIRRYRVAGSRLEPGRVDGGTVTFGATPLRAEKIAVPQGDYVSGFLVRDIAGQVSYQYRDLRVGAAH